MTEPKKPTRPLGSTTEPAPKTISDVSKPGKSAPSGTSKPVLISNRPLLQDPMVKPKTEAAEADTATDSQPVANTSVEPTSKQTGGNKVIAPLKTDAEPKSEAETKPESETTEPTADPDASSAVPDDDAKAKETAATETTGDAKADTTDADSAVTDGQNIDAKAAEAAEAEAAKQAEHDAAIQKLVDGKQYFLPINSVEQRKTKRFVLLGLLLAVVLAVAWVDIALDAGLIQLGNVKPLTHFFSD